MIYLAYIIERSFLLRNLYDPAVSCVIAGYVPFP